MSDIFPTCLQRVRNQRVGEQRKREGANRASLWHSNFRQLRLEHKIGSVRRIRPYTFLCSFQEGLRFLDAFAYSKAISFFGQLAYVPVHFYLEKFQRRQGAWLYSLELDHQQFNCKV